MGFDYVPKAGKIHVKTLTLADTWYQVLTADQARGIRGFKIKSRMVFNSSGSPTTIPRPFDLALKETPETGDTTLGDGYWSNSGAGSGDTFGPVKGLWARSSVANTTLEIMTFE